MDHSKALGRIEQAGSLANLSRYMVLLMKRMAPMIRSELKVSGRMPLGLEPLYRSHKAQIPCWMRSSISTDGGNEVRNRSASN